MKPQRPLRAFRIQDENVPPAVPRHKTIHHRNKSSPALSTAANGGGVKGAARRTAFGDVSNTLHANRPVRDDLSIITRNGIEIGEKLVVPLDGKKSTAFLRPAQRPLSVTGLKGLLNNVPNITAPAPASKLVAAEAQPTIQAANMRKAMTKRSSTAVFKDLVPPPVQADKPAPNIYKPLPASIPNALAPREISTRQQQYYPQDSKLASAKVQRILHESATAVSGKVDYDQASAYSSTSTLVEDSAYRSDGIYIDEKGYLRSYEHVEEREQPLAASSSIDKESEGGVLLEEVKPTATTTYKNQSRTIPPQRSTTLEPEEYWDDGEDDEIYDEDEGFVTARSYKSRGDNTTGGATTILFPKLNQKIKKELATAKVLTEERKTYQELEDEAFDTSMVAEYGEEIFSYMKELEVRSSFN